MTENAVEQVTLTIDGQEVTVPKGTLIIRAAEQLGNIIPRFCDHPLLDPVGACRQCVVEVEGQRKPVMSCTMPVAPDMEVRTHLTDPVAKKAQEGTLELLLINHPLDCPMCDKGGECPLQDQALKHGANTSRFIDQKRRYEKPVAVSQQVLLDRERCVLCARCTRFSEQISGDPFIELFERGALEQVAMYEDEPYESYFSGNVIQICPVGALTSADYRFKARPFDVVTTPSVCDGCSAGCNLTVQSRRGEIQRQLARTNMAVNEAWNCDKGRFGFHHVTAPSRLTEPMVRTDDGLKTASWAQVLSDASQALGAAEASRVAVITGSRLADEDAYVTAKYARTVLGTDNVDYRTHFAAEGVDDELTAIVGRDGATYGDVESAGVIVVAGLDPEEEVPILHLRLRKAWRAHKAKIVVVGPTMGTLDDLAWRWVPASAGQEAAALEQLQNGDSEVAAALREANAPVVLVGERAGAGSVTASVALAEATGGKSAYVPRRAGSRGAIEAGLASGTLPGGRRLADATDRADVAAVWGADLPAESGLDLHGVLRAAAAGEIDVLHLIGVDLATDAVSTELAREALAKVDTVIVQDLAATATVSEFADIVLPATGRQERAGSTTNWEGRTQRFARAVDGPDLVLDDFEVLIQLAALLGVDLGFNDLDGIRAERERLGRRSQPHQLPAVSVPASAAPSGDALTAVVRPQLLGGGTMLAGATDLVATAREPNALVSIATAARIGISNGAKVQVASTESDTGGPIELTAEVRHDVVDDTVILPAHVAGTPIWTLANQDGSVTVTISQAPAKAIAGQEVA